MAHVSGAGGASNADWSAAEQGDADQSSATGTPAEGEARPQSSGFGLEDLAALGQEVAARLSRSGDGPQEVTVQSMVELPTQDGSPGPQIRAKLRFNAALPKDADPGEPADKEVEGQG